MYHLQARYILKIYENLDLKIIDTDPEAMISKNGVRYIVKEYNSNMDKINDILAMDENQIILAYGRDPFGLNYLSEYGLKQYIDMV